ncbi:MAG: hypothetical protein ACK4WH_01630 [Phycisphaerales bacterium]
MSGVLEQVDLRDADAVIAALEAGAAANTGASCRVGSIDVVTVGPGERLVLTGDLHDNPLHMARVVRAAGMDEPGSGVAPAHLTLHELIHGDRLGNGMDFSYRVLVRAALLKAAFPPRVHTLLANHELAQAMRTAIVKDGVLVVEAFDHAVEYVFGGRAGEVRRAVEGFIFSMPLALRVVRGGLGDILCAHSLPGPEVMGIFDPTVLERPMEASDLVPRRGSAHLMVWGRGHSPEQLETLARRWGVSMFVLGHEHAEAGALALPPNALVLNSDHERGVMVVVDPGEVRGVEDLLGSACPLSEGVARSWSAS